MSQQQPHARSNRRPLSRALGPRAAALAGALVALPLVTACGGGDDATPAAAGRTSTPSRSAAPAAGVVAPAKVEVIAGLTGCKVKIRTEADELREGVCHTKKGDYLITTFPEEKLKETWLESASVYGGKYLVGMRWVVSAKPEMLEPLRAKLGGTVRELRGIGPSTSAS
ncbi:hypothetical protein STAFG_2634 [Streptomyces afghaniensis 772]|uniref:Lipoprotein n=1 Tax=Streptomyces afghaniensis 772 TaxID=1283301 RepID=S4MWT4_9ACTN|nr:MULTISPECIES: hypothetical protein [Streptomyces]EPJ40310.1 hypothetical protein STAFG_2634 [Streptomyces afghaniensis 772]UOB08750.1 hypothetical protein MQE23_06640 [Streptomyces sp. HP-A2021]